jgi:hypothetical protein
MVILMSMVVPSGLLWAQHKPPAVDNLFYHGYDYGTEADFNPLSMTVGYAYAIMQLNNYNNKLGGFSYKQASDNLMWNLERPGAVIGQRGWKAFMMTEVIPTSLRMTNVQYWPNYKLHLIGGGMLHIATTEWFAFHGYPYPWLYSLATNIGMHYLNEVVEQGDYVGPDTDPIADIYIFGPLGFLLFHNPRVATFFSHTLNLAPWTFQALYVPSTNELINNGMKFSFKYFFPWNKRLGIFYLTGTEGMVGGSYKVNHTDTFTLGGGWAAKDIYQVETNTGVRVQSTTLIVSGAVFYDRNNSLLASLILGGARGYKMRLNVYPGVLPLGRHAPGFAVTLQDHNQFAFGINWSFTPIGLAVRAN